ncbi:unnamed protein product, partial [Dovyalis caffra]
IPLHGKVRADYGLPETKTRPYEASLGLDLVDRHVKSNGFSFGSNGAVCMCLSLYISPLST